MSVDVSDHGPERLPHGSWPSPISAELVAAGGVGIGWPSVRGDSVWWSEQRPAEGGRSVPVSAAPGTAPSDRLTAPWSARTRVHEYGGGAWWLGADHLYFAEWSDQRLYRLAIDVDGDGDDDVDGDRDGEPRTAAPEPLTPAPEVPAGWRYADGREHPGRTWLVAVREDHHGIGAGEGERSEPANELVAVPLGEVGEPQVLVSGPDFVACPRFSPDGRWLSWIEWDHPAMPWDATRLLVAPVFANLRLGNPKPVAGGSGGPGAPDGESIVGADWTSAGQLVFSTDRSGWWNLHAWHPERGTDRALTALEAAEIGGPAWVLGLRPWVELADGRLAVKLTTDAVDSLAILEPPTTGGDPVRPGSGAETGPLEPVSPQPVVLPDLSEIVGLAAAGDGRVVVAGSGPRSLPSVTLVDVGDGTPRTETPGTETPGTETPGVETVRSPDDTGVDPAWFSVAEPISYDSGPVDGPHGAADGEIRRANAFFYPPTAPGIAGPTGAAPPLVVMGHGGPTAHSDPALSLKVQYWTSRGFAVVDVNYGGSTGFGRDYRRLLQGRWGEVDVEDCIAAAAHLADRGLVDGDRMAIRGGSAGGFTVLAALERSERFGAGTNLFGVADLTALAADTHKFESRYLDGLIGPYPERADLYRDRSPINHTDLLSSPLLVLQGLEDEIVPPNQSEAIVAAVAAKGLPHAYVTFEGEQHGFRRAENIIRSFEVELWFYGRVFGFDPADEIDAPDGAVGLAEER